MNRDELKEMMMMHLGFHSRCGAPVQHILFDIDDDDDDADEYKEDYKDIIRIMKMIWLMIKKNED